MRNIGLCVEDTVAAANACRFAAENIWKPGDIFHLIYVVKSLKPPMEVFHQVAGTSYSFSQPGRHHEGEKISAAKRAIEKRFLPILSETTEVRREPVSYQFHLFAEKHDAKPDTIGKTLLKCVGDVGCDVLVICSHNWDEDPNATVDRFEGHVGRVAQYVMDHCSIPLCIT